MDPSSGMDGEDRDAAKMGHEGRAMKVRTAREFEENAAGVLRSKDPVLVTRRGRVAGIFFPQPELSLPVELKKEIFEKLSGEIAHQLEANGTSEEEILADFAQWRKKRRETRSRR